MIFFGNLSARETLYFLLAKRLCETGPMIRSTPLPAASQLVESWK